MIVKSGRLYLWQNQISGKELIIKVGTGSNSSEYVEIDQTELAQVVTSPTITLTSEDEYNTWLANPSADVWYTSIANINSYTSTGSPAVITNRYLFEDERKIIIYVKIVASTAFELGEMGLFVKGTNPNPDIMISRNLMQKQFISTSESKIIKYTINTL